MSETSHNLFKSHKNHFSSKNYPLNRILVYTLLVLLAAEGYALLVSGLSLLIAHPIAPDSPIVVGIVVFVSLWPSIRSGNGLSGRSTPFSCWVKPPSARNCYPSATTLRMPETCWRSC